jgi:hypothetical protein
MEQTLPALTLGLEEEEEEEVCVVDQLKRNIY